MPIFDGCPFCGTKGITVASGTWWCVNCTSVGCFQPEESVTDSSKTLKNSMDPDKTLDEIRELCSGGWLDHPDDSNRLIDRIAALDEWMQRGGVPPKGWQR